MRLLLLIILFFNLSSLLQAQTYDTTYSELRRPGQAVRNLGMGNTGVALSADESALYYNPAGLTNLSSKEFSFIHTSYLPNLVDDMSYDFLTFAMPFNTS